MFSATIKVKAEVERVKRAAERAAFSNFRHAAASIRKTAVQSIEKAPQGVPSEPGQPPHTHRRAFLRRAWRFAADEHGAVIGPRFSVVGEAAAIHERGETFEGVSFPERPTATPALEANLDRFAGRWAGSIGE